MERFLERLTALSTSAKAGLLAAVVLLITAGAYFGLIHDVEDRVEHLAGQQTALDRTLAEKKELADNLHERGRELLALDATLRSGLGELPEEKDLDDLISEFNGAAKRAGLEIASITPGAETFDVFYGRIPIRVSVTGDYDEIARFIQELSSLRRIVNVSNLRLAGGAPRGEKVLLGSEFIATAFRYHDATKAKLPSKR